MDKQALDAAADELEAALAEAMNGNDTTPREMARRVIETYKAHEETSDGK